jgi:hypothetical protein
MNVMSYGCLQSLVLVVAGASEVQRQDENKLRSHSGGIAREIGVEPTARHAADPGIIPVVIRMPAAPAMPTRGNAPVRRCTLLATPS